MERQIVVRDAQALPDDTRGGPGTAVLHQNLVDLQPRLLRKGRDGDEGMVDVDVSMIVDTSIMSMDIDISNPSRYHSRSGSDRARPHSRQARRRDFAIAVELTCGRSDMSHEQVWAIVRLILGTLQVGATMGVVFLLRTGVSSLTIWAVSITALFTLTSLMLFRKRETK